MTDDAREPTYRWSPAVATRTLDGAAFILVQSRMLRLDDVGTRIWELCRGGATPSVVAKALASEYDVEMPRAAADAAQFMESLRQRGMLVCGAPAGG